jgi:hypothetical protein
MMNGSNPVNNLDNQEQGVDLQTRQRQQAQNDEKNAAKTKDAIERTKKGGPSAAEELEGFRQRMEAARELRPSGDNLHCSECAQRWVNGRDATIQAIEG